MRIFIAGGTGQVGTRLLHRLIQRGEEIILLSRDVGRAKRKLEGKLNLNPMAKVSFVEGDPRQAGAWMRRVNECHGVVNLVGENVFAKRWNDKFEFVLRDSRLKSTAQIVTAIQQAPVRPNVLIQGSAIGYYGMPGESELTESAPPGHDFLARLCIDWEAAAKPVEEMGVRLVLLRTGVVLDKAGGALRKMLTPFQFFVGGRVGSGQQWVSWIHHEDEVGIILLCLDKKQAHGPINAVAPKPCRNVEMAKAIGGVLHRPSFFPTPAFLLKLGLGGVSEIILGSQKVLPKRAQELGYRFKYLEIHQALREILGKK
jgi:uncharacterized protein (TIGR01777 family)